MKRPYISESRKKRGARLLANLAEQYGFLVAKPCESCGKPSRHKHHDDYDKPLEVTWLCVGCHVRLHVTERSEEIIGVVGVLERFLADSEPNPTAKD